MIWLLSGCAVEESAESGGHTVEATVWPDPITTLTETVVGGDRLTTTSELNPGLPDGLAAAEAAGLGTWEMGPGEPWIVRDDLAPGSGASENSVSITMFVHQTDAQLADCESPTRVVALDGTGQTEAALRPQELYQAHVLDAAAHRLNQIHDLVGVDFLVATGDNADSAQGNETEWFRNILDGAAFRPDSGDPDTQVDDDGNDPLAEFTPVGLDFPWYAVAGNHDVLVQGNFDPARYVDAAVGTDAPLGTRDFSLPGGPLGFSAVADASRRVLERSDIATIYLDSPASPGPVGHGFSAANVTDDTVDWSVAPVPGVRLISVDANPYGPTDGLLTVVERETLVIPALEAATAAGDLILLTSHYALAELPMEDGGVFGDVLTQYPNVVLVVAGHWHVNRVVPYGTSGDPSAFWEIQSASTVDWPAQVRLIELVANSDGTLSIFTTMVDAPAPEGSMALRGRELTLMDWQSGWRQASGPGELSDRNTELVQVLPVEWKGGTGPVRSFLLP